MNFRPIKIYLRNYTAMKRGNYHESSDCFEYPNKSLLKSSYPKKYLPHFTPKKILKSKISNPKKSFDYRYLCHLKSGVPPLGSQGHKEGKKLLQNAHNNKFTHTLLFVMESLENTHHYQRKYEVFTLTVKTLS